MEGDWLTHFEAGPTRGDSIAMLHGGELLGGGLEHVWRGLLLEMGIALQCRRSFAAINKGVSRGMRGGVCSTAVVGALLFAQKVDEGTGTVL